MAMRPRCAKSILGMEGEVHTFPADTRAASVASAESDHVQRPGTFEVKLEWHGSAVKRLLPFVADIECKVRKPFNAGTSPPLFSTNLRLVAAEAWESDVVALHPGVTKQVSEDMGMTILQLGTPAGCESRADQLAELRRSGRVAHFETQPNKVIIYLDGLRANSGPLSLPVELEARIPGRYTAPASAAYPYYHAEQRVWDALPAFYVRAAADGGGDGDDNAVAAD
mmetsp:Transcript_2027/g.5201  ORF Transcript_2027/g.5201 Transcript_2027/m.5201 type:complete len:225 (-) Transcript_2027:134-808(-)